MENSIMIKRKISSKEEASETLDDAFSIVKKYYSKPFGTITIVYEDFMGTHRNGQIKSDTSC